MNGSSKPYVSLKLCRIRADTEWGLEVEEAMEMAVTGMGREAITTGTTREEETTTSPTTSPTTTTTREDLRATGDPTAETIQEIAAGTAVPAVEPSAASAVCWTAVFDDRHIFRFIDSKLTISHYRTFSCQGGSFIFF